MDRISTISEISGADCCSFMTKHERSENFHTMNERVARELIRAYQHPHLACGDKRFSSGRTTIL